MSEDGKEKIKLSDLQRKRWLSLGALVCPDCGCRDFRSPITRTTQTGLRKRKRICRHCGRTVTTLEGIE